MWERKYLSRLRIVVIIQHTHTSDGARDTQGVDRLLWWGVGCCRWLAGCLLLAKAICIAAQALLLHHDQCLPAASPCCLLTLLSLLLERLIGDILAADTGPAQSNSKQKQAQ